MNTRTHTKTLATFAIAAIAIVIATAPVEAAETAYWDGTTTSGDADGGNGTWNNTGTNTNWDDAATAGSDIPWDGNSSGDDTAVFGGTGGTVTLGAVITLQNLSLNDLTSANNYTITGSTLSFGGGGTIAAASNTSGAHFSDFAFIESAITGAPSVDLSSMGSNRQLAFAPTAGSMTLGAVSGSGVVHLAGSTTGNTIASSSAKNRWGGSGEWTLTGTASSYETFIDSGDVIVSTGTLRSNNRAVKISGGTLHYNNPGAVFSDASGIPTNNDNGDTLSMRGGNLDNTSGAAITTSTYNPRMSWSSDWTFIGSLGASSDLNMGTGAVRLFSGDRQVTVSNAAATLTLGGAITDSGSNYGLIKAGDGTLELTGNSTYTGDTTVSGGTLGLGADNVINDVSDMIFNTGTTLETGGFDDTFATLDINGSVIFDFENLGTSNLVFSDSSGVSWGSDLDIINFGGDDSIQFGMNSSGLLSSQLDDITINGLEVAIDSNGFLNAIVPIPEPSTLALAALGLLSLGFVGWRRRQR